MLAAVTELGYRRNGPGQNAIAVAPGANLQLSAPDVLESFGEDLRSCQCLLMQLECRAELAAGLASWAREAGCVSILNPAPTRPLPPDALASFDIITPMRASFRRSGLARPRRRRD